MIRAVTGLDIHLHLFRHVAAYLFLKRYPGEYETVRRLLGPTSIKTTIAFYCGLESEEAFRRYDELLDEYRPKRSER